MRNSARWALPLVGIVLTPLCVAGVIFWPPSALIVIGVVVLLGLSIKRPQIVAPALVLAAFPFMRPNILGGNYALIAVAMCLVAAFIALVSDAGRFRIPRSYLVVASGVAVMYLWTLINAAIFSATDTVSTILQGIVTTALPVVAVGVVIANPIRRRILVRGFVWLMILLCASYAFTLVAGLAIKFTTLVLGSFDIDKNGWIAILYLPFTPATGYQGLGGVTFPRFTGLGREPGWMSMYAGLALLLWPRVGRVRLPGAVFLIIGLLGTFSTAGFGAFVVVIILAWMARGDKGSDPAVHFLSFLVKLVALGLAGWVALTAPVFGYMAKGDVNAVSLDDRTRATNAGLGAIVDNPFGGVHTGVSEGINLLASLAPLGIPFFVIVVGTLLLPRIGHPNKAATTAPILLILIVLLLSQPASDSTFVFIMAGLIYTASLPDMPVLAPKERAQGPVKVARPAPSEMYARLARQQGMTRQID